MYGGRVGLEFKLRGLFSSEDELIGLEDGKTCKLCVWRDELVRPIRRLGVLEKEIKILTWLILPVVIRLSQRLSHACLSINNFVL
jgi:hypothetical protein